MISRSPSRRDISGWIVFDKPAGMTSTRAVSCLKGILNAKKAGHAGTLDPLATGLLPVAFGDATKTVPFVQEGEKAYRFTVRWGAETDTDDADGEVTEQSGNRPTETDIRALLPAFTGSILQLPPTYSAVKLNGERAYYLARQGEMPILSPRQVTIHALDLISRMPDEAVFEARCGKGTYVRALARDLGRSLKCFGHVAALRRTRVGPFYEEDAVSLEVLEEAAAAGKAPLRGIEAGLAEFPRINVDPRGAARLRRGQSLLLRGPDTPPSGCAYAACGGLVAIGKVENGELIPDRVFRAPDRWMPPG